MLVLLQLAAAAFSGLGQEPNPPVWPSSVHVFTPRNSTDEIERVVQSAYVENGGREDHGQFSADHFAFLFMPGTYLEDCGCMSERPPHVCRRQPYTMGR